MVKIAIRQFQPGAGVADDAALEQFQRQWATYGKLVAADCLAHAEVGRILHDAMNETCARPFSVLDIACGDASEMRQALAGTQVRHYHGIDLSQPALELAAANLKDATFDVELDHRDFVEAVESRPEPADIAFCSLSVHHLTTADKRALLTALRPSTAKFAMIYEPTRAKGESREEYLERFRRVNRPLWTMLSDEEWSQIDHHVTTCDFPEEASAWLAFGREAGFAASRQIFLDPTGFYGLYRYDR